MVQHHPTPTLAREKRTEGETVDRAPRRQHPGFDFIAALGEPYVEKMRGPKLVALWIALIALSWAVAGGVGYGLWRVVSGLF